MLGPRELGGMAQRSLDAPLWRRLADPPNLMSLSRIPLGAALWWRPHDLAWLLGVMAVAAGSDVLDGRMARRLGARRGTATGISSDTLGAVLDPICDKLFVA